jgi:hypothetical protein
MFLSLTFEANSIHVCRYANEMRQHVCNRNKISLSDVALISALPADWRKAGPNCPDEMRLILTIDPGTLASAADLCFAPVKDFAFCS